MIYIISFRNIGGGIQNFRVRGDGCGDKNTAK
jgi:hypothetical protein